MKKTNGEGKQKEDKEEMFYRMNEKVTMSFILIRHLSRDDFLTFFFIKSLHDNTKAQSLSEWATRARNACFFTPKFDLTY